MDKNMDLYINFRNSDVEIIHHEGIITLFAIKDLNVSQAWALTF